MPNLTEIEKTFCEQMDVRTHGWTDEGRTFETHFVRSTHKSGPKNLMNFCLVTLEFKRGKDAHPSSIIRLATFAWWRHCYTLRGSVLSFVGMISTQFCFSYSLWGVIAMPRGLYARLYNAFLVYFRSYSLIFCFG